MKILCFLQHLSEVVHIPHTKMQKYTDIHDYLHITEGNYGNALVSEFSRRTDNFRSRFSYWPESAKTRTNDKSAPGNAPWSCLPVHCGALILFGLQLWPLMWLTQTPPVCWERLPAESQTNIHDRPCCTWFLSKLHKTGAKGDQCLYISDLYSQEFSNRYVYLYRTETSRSRDIWRFSSIHRKGKIIFLLNKLRNVNSVTSLKKLSQYL